GSTTESCSFRDNLQTFNIGGIAMKLPPDQAGNPIPFLHSGAFEHPVLRLRYHPVASTGYRSDVSVAHQHSFVRSSLGKRTVRLFPHLRMRPVTAIGTGSEDPAIWVAALAF